MTKKRPDGPRQERPAIDWDALDTIKYRNEGEAVAALIADRPLDPRQSAAIEAEALALVEASGGGDGDKRKLHFSPSSAIGVLLLVANGRSLALCGSTSFLLAS